MVTISGLYRYPIKGCAAESLQTAVLNRYGIAVDRYAMIVDENGVFITQRTCPKMATIRPSYSKDWRQMLIEAPKMGQFSLSLTMQAADRIAAECEVRIREERLAAIDRGDAAAAWLSDHLSQRCRLVTIDTLRYCRIVDEHFSNGEEETAFSDGFPLLVIGDASLNDLNQRLTTPVPMNRFRPNITVAGAEPYAEDEWYETEVNGTPIYCVKPCARCSVTRVNQEAGTTAGNEPLHTLARYRTRLEPITERQGAMFGQNAIAYLAPLKTRVISVGDTLTVQRYLSDTKITE